MSLNTTGMSALNYHIVPPGGGYSGPVNKTSDGNSKTVSGTVTDLNNGVGSFSRTMEEVNGQKTIDKTVTFANGKTKSTEKTVTINDDGSKTITKVGNNGKTSTIQETVAKDSNGTSTVTKEKTNADGSTKETVATTTKSATGGIDRQITHTNADGQTETLDRQVTKTAGGRSVVTTGTGYNGNPIYDETTWTKSMTA